MKGNLIGREPLISSTRARGLWSLREQEQAIKSENWPRIPSDFVSLNITSSLENVDLRALAVSQGWDQTSQLIATIASGVYVYSSDTSDPALLIEGSFPNGVVLTNNGFIVGMGGRGGNSAITDGEESKSEAEDGESGGPALEVSSAVTINNLGTIAGGGGGGGGGAPDADGGGGGGGGRSGLAFSAGGIGLVNGNSGTNTAAGTGGSTPPLGGNGGNWGESGTAGADDGKATGGAGGDGGEAVIGNANITWTNTGTRLGAII